MSGYGQPNAPIGFRDRRSDHPQFSDLTVGDYAGGMPNIRISEMFGSLLRQLVWLIPLVLIGFVVALYATRDIKRTFTGEGRIMAQIGQEYVFESVTGMSSQGVMLTPEVISLNEVSIMRSSEVVDEVIDQMVAEFGETRFAEGAYKKIRAAEHSGDQAAIALAEVNLHSAVEKSFSAAPLPKSAVIDVSYKHPDGDIAVAATNAFIKAYKDYRKTIFIEGSVDPISDRRKATEDQFSENERAIQRFLKRHHIADFESELTGATGRTEGLRSELNVLQAQMAETEAALFAVESQLRQTPQQINIYVDDRAAQRVAQAELELKNLLSRYLPGSDPVRAKEGEIAQYKALQASASGQAVGGRRVGPNVVFQDLMTRRNMLQSTADSLREKEFAVTDQLRNAEGKVRKFTRLSPEYQTLLRKRSTLDQRLRGYTTKEQEALITQQQAEADSENITVISWAKLPRKGRNMRAVLTLVGTMGWALFLFIIALLRVFLDPKLYTKPAVINGRRASDPGFTPPSGGGGGGGYRAAMPMAAQNVSGVQAYAPPPADTGPAPVFHKDFNDTHGSGAMTPPDDYFTNPYEAPMGGSYPTGTLPSGETR